MTRNFETDYFIIGAGAAAMAFADELLTNSNARILIVDRRDKPGGHWNDAYPFVRLHQPSAYYGVNSRELGSRSKDAVGFNKGLYNLASGAEVLGYFDQVMQQRMLASGRVQYFPMSNVTADDRFQSLLTGENYRVTVRKAVVDSAYWTFDIPSTRPPRYPVAPDVRCVPPNAIPHAAKQDDDFVVVGPGKTGIDSCLWLLERGIDPARIRWVMPNDAWFINRANIQPGDDFFLTTFQGLAQQFEAVGAADGVADLFDRLEACGQLLRLDPGIRPTIYRCATITEDELAQLRRIKNIVRQGYVRAVESTRIVLDRGEMPLTSNTLVIDCSASGISRKPPVPVWSGNRINVQMIRTCQPAFSAALIGFIEATFADENQKNALCQPVPNPVLDTDWLRMLAVSTKNRVAWRSQPKIEEWLLSSRLNTLFSAPARVKPEDTEKIAVLKRLQEASSAAVAKMPQLLAAAATAS
jgi:hypothetical protein